MSNLNVVYDEGTRRLFEHSQEVIERGTDTIKNLDAQSRRMHELINMSDKLANTPDRRPISTDRDE